jgi:hypothetical protein
LPFATRHPSTTILPPRPDKYLDLNQFSLFSPEKTPPVKAQRRPAIALSKVEGATAGRLPFNPKSEIRNSHAFPPLLGIMIRALTVPEILDEEIAKKTGIGRFEWTSATSGETILSYDESFG